MNEFQRLWWEQAKSDLATFALLRREGAAECHLLHYLQMAVEKISKAYLWRSGIPPTRSHVGFMPLLRSLTSRERGRQERRRIAHIFMFTQWEDMAAWAGQVAPLAYELQNLAPALANDGPNPEYPWPHDRPTQCPALYTFALWQRFKGDMRGRNLLLFIERAVARFEQYA